MFKPTDSGRERDRFGLSRVAQVIVLALLLCFGIWTTLFVTSVAFAVPALDSWEQTHRTLGSAVNAARRAAIVQRTPQTLIIAQLPSGRFSLRRFQKRVATGRIRALALDVLELRPRDRGQILGQNGELRWIQCQPDGTVSSPAKPGFAPGDLLLMDKNGDELLVTVDAGGRVSAFRVVR